MTKFAPGGWELDGLDDQFGVWIDTFQLAERTSTQRSIVVGLADVRALLFKIGEPLVPEEDDDEDEEYENENENAESPDANHEDDEDADYDDGTKNPANTAPSTSEQPETTLPSIRSKRRPEPVADEDEFTLNDEKVLLIFIPSYISLFVVDSALCVSSPKSTAFAGPRKILRLDAWCASNVTYAARYMSTLKNRLQLRVLRRPRTILPNLPSRRVVSSAHSNVAFVAALVGRPPANQLLRSRRLHLSPLVLPVILLHLKQLLHDHLVLVPSLRPISICLPLFLLPLYIRHPHRFPPSNPAPSHTSTPAPTSNVSKLNGSKLIIGRPKRTSGSK